VDLAYTRSAQPIACEAGQISQPFVAAFRNETLAALSLITLSLIALRLIQRAERFEHVGADFEFVRADAGA
jgi:hypothetical protein